MLLSDRDAIIYAQNNLPQSLHVCGRLGRLYSLHILGGETTATPTRAWPASSPSWRQRPPVSGESHPARCHCSASDSLPGKCKAISLRAVNCRQEFLSLSGWVVSVASPSPCTKDDKHHVHLQNHTATTQQPTALLCEARTRQMWLLCLWAARGGFVRLTPPPACFLKCICLQILVVDTRRPLAHGPTLLGFKKGPDTGRDLSKVIPHKD